VGKAAYTLEIYYADSPTPRERHAVSNAAEALSMIKELLAIHPQCERLVVMMGMTQLFAVDCKGARIP
jgi:hypothetical protein